MTRDLGESEKLALAEFLRARFREERRIPQESIFGDGALMRGYAVRHYVDHPDYREEWKP